MYMQSIAFHGVSTVKVEKINPVTSQNPRFNMERLRITIFSKIGEATTETTITLFGEDNKELKLEVVECS